MFVKESALHNFDRFPITQNMRIWSKPKQAEFDRLAIQNTQLLTECEAGWIWRKRDTENIGFWYMPIRGIGLQPRWDRSRKDFDRSRSRFPFTEKNPWFWPFCDTEYRPLTEWDHAEGLNLTVLRYGWFIKIFGFRKSLNLTKSRYSIYYKS